MQVDDKWSQTDEVFLYIEPGVRATMILILGIELLILKVLKSFDTGFEPDAIDIYSEQQIDSINQEVVTRLIVRCVQMQEAGATVFTRPMIYTQWSMGMGRTSIHKTHIDKVSKYFWL